MPRSSTKKDSLKVADYRLMNMDRRFWGACLEKVPVSANKKVSNYLAQIHEAARIGAGAYFYGSACVGKSCAAALIAKEARAWGYTVYCTTPAEYREALKHRTAFNEDMSISERVWSVEFLVIDDLFDDMLTDKMFGVNELRGMLSSRCEKCKVTIIASPIPMSVWNETHNGLFHAMLKSTVPVEIVDTSKTPMVKQRSDFLGKMFEEPKPDEKKSDGKQPAEPESPPESQPEAESSLPPEAQYLAGEKRVEAMIRRSRRGLKGSNS